MNVKAIFGSVIGVLLLLIAVLMVLLLTKPAFTVAPAAQYASDDANAGGGQEVLGNQGAELDQVAARFGDVVASLVARIERLEIEIERLDPPRELADLQARVTKLERSVRDFRQTNAASRGPTGEIAELRRENASLKRAYDQLASKVASAENRTSPAIQDLRVLQQKVFSLETAVQRLESRR